MKFKITKEQIILFALVFIAFAAGRFGDLIGGGWNFMHHWIPGAALIVFGLKFKNKYSGYLIAIGVGLVISDLNDLINLRFWGVDVPHVWKFWSIN